MRTSIICLKGFKHHGPSCCCLTTPSIWLRQASLREHGAYSYLNISFHFIQFPRSVNILAWQRQDAILFCLCLKIKQDNKGNTYMIVWNKNPGWAKLLY